MAFAGDAQTGGTLEMAGIDGTHQAHGGNMSDNKEVNARIVYWGVEGAGKTASVETIHAKLRPDHRGELKRVPTRLDPSVHYDTLPIALGNVQGTRTQLQIIAMPGGSEHAHTRKQLLDRVDGIVIVVDADPARSDANAESVKELRTALAAYGRRLEELPFVVQYNKCDLADPYAIEALHRKLDFGTATVFETVATHGKGVLQVLSTISKGVIRALREAEPAAAAPVVAEPPPAPVQPLREPDLMSDAEPLPDLDPEEEAIGSSETVVELEADVLPPPPAAGRPTPPTSRAAGAPAPAAPFEAQSVMEAAILSEGAGDAEVLEADDAAMRTELAFDKPFDQLANEKPAPGARFGADLRVVSVGLAEKSGERGVRVPLVLGNDEGETLTLALTVQLDPLLEDTPGWHEEDPG